MFIRQLDSKMSMAKTSCTREGERKTLTLFNTSQKCYFGVIFKGLRIPYNSQISTKHFGETESWKVECSC